MIQALLTFYGLSVAGAAAFLSAEIEPEDMQAGTLGGFCLGALGGGAIILTLARFA